MILKRKSGGTLKTMRDPFSSMRAHTASESLTAYGAKLAQTLCASTSALKDLQDEMITILIEDLGHYSARVWRVHWEVLENPELWPEDYRPSSVTTLRQAENGAQVTDAIPCKPKKEVIDPKRILAASARPNSFD